MTHLQPAGVQAGSTLGGGSMSGAGLSVEDRQRQGYFQGNEVTRAPSLEAMRKLARTGAKCKDDPNMVIDAVRKGEPGQTLRQILRVRRDGDSHFAFSGELVGSPVFFEIYYDVTTGKPTYVNIH